MATKRALIDTGSDKRYVRRNARAEFKEGDDVGRSLSADRRTKAKKVAKRGQGRPAPAKALTQAHDAGTVLRPLSLVRVLRLTLASSRHASRP
jgi:hypothetical protein